MWERWIPGVVLFLGFLWIRSRARSLRSEDGSRKALYGVFFVLAPLLLAGKQVFDVLPFDRVASLAIEVLALILAFVLTGFLFLRNKPSADSRG